MTCKSGGPFNFCAGGGTAVTRGSEGGGYPCQGTRPARWVEVADAVAEGGGEKAAVSAAAGVWVASASP